MIFGVPRKPIVMGVLDAKSNGLLKYSHSGVIGLRFAWRKRLRVSSAWSKSLSHMYLVK